MAPPKTVAQRDWNFNMSAKGQRVQSSADPKLNQPVEIKFQIQLKQILYKAILLLK